MLAFRAPANIQLRRAQLTLMLATLIPTVLMTGVGILLLAIGSDSRTLVPGVLVLAFCTTSLTGYILGSIFVSRGASVARFQNDFLSSVSHELNTPLTSIGLFIDTLRDERMTDPEERRRCLDLLDREIHRLGGLVERLLSLSRIEAAGRNAFKRSRVSLAKVADDAMVALEAAALHDDTLEVEVDVPSDLHVVGDEQALATALSNLLINAWKYNTNERRAVSLRANVTKRHIELVVTDNGPGIPKDELRAIFERFERGRAAIDSGRGGSGLGLAIVRAIVRAHRGRLEVDSRPGEGSEFRVQLRKAP